MILPGTDLLKAAAVALLLLPTAPASAASATEPYKIAVGDILSLWVEGAPSLNLRMPVGVDGMVTIPLAGQTPAAGLTIEQIRNAVASLLGQHLLFERSPDGRSVGVPIGRDQVAVDIAEYRPIYVTGDVAKPGAETFRPGMTVRQAISMAGGYDLLRTSGSNPLLDAFDLRSQQETLWIVYAQTLANVRRIQAEITASPLPDIAGELGGLPISPQVKAQIAETVTAQLASRNDDYRVQESTLDQNEVSIGKQVAVLKEELARQNAGLAEDQKDLDAVQTFYKNNTVSMTRVLDARRSLTFSSSRAMQTMADVNQLTRQGADVAAKKLQLDAQRRVALETDLQDGQTKLASLRAQIDAVASKLLYASALKSEMSIGFIKTRAVTIHRAADGATEDIAARDDQQLRPGDVVEVAFDVARLGEETATR